MCRCKVKHRKTVSHRSIDTLVKVSSEDEDIKGRLQNYYDWRKSLTVDIDILPGMYLDVRDTLYVWCVGVVKEIIFDKRDIPKVLLIHYRDWGALYDEYIPITSTRLAPYRTFTSRIDLPRYQRQPLERERGFFFVRFR